jgi:fibronectin-binding autotransporter adhesin
VRHLSPLIRAAVSIAALVTALMLMTGSALASGCDTWTGGGGDGSWSTAANWSNGVPGMTNPGPGAVDVCIPANVGTVVLNYETTINSVSVGSGDTLDIWGQQNLTHGLLTLVNQDSGTGIASGATVVLGYHGASSDNAYETHGGFDAVSGTLVNNGSITSADTGDETPNELQGSFTNNGTVVVNNALTDENANGEAATGTWTNAGSIAIVSGQGLQLGDAGSTFSFSEPSGTIANSGSFQDVGGSAFDITGSGTTSGSQLLVDAGDIQLSSSGSGSVDDNTGGGTLTGTIASGWTLQINGNAAYNNGLATTNGNVTNDGTILLGQASSQTDATLDATGGTLTNNGTITSENVNPSQTSGSGETNNVINGSFVNTGTLQINDSLVGAPTSWTLGGTVNIPSGQQIALSGPSSGTGTVTFTGTVNTTGGFSLGDGVNATASSGTISGNPVVVGNGVLDASGTGTGTFHIESGGGQIGSDIASGYTVWASGIPGLSHGDLTPTGSYTNHGTLEFGSMDGTHGTLTVPAGDTLTNDGTLIFEATDNGGDGLNGALLNNATVSLQNNVTGTGQIANDGTFVLTAASGDNTAASFLQGAGGTLAVAVTGGGTPVVPQIALTGAAKLAGKLAVSTTGGTVTGSFPIITATAVTGTLTPTFSGEGYNLKYASGSVTLTGPAAVAPQPAPSPTVASVIGGAGLFRVKLKCAATKACATYTVTATVKVAEKVRVKVRGTTRTETRTATLTIAKTTGKLAAGKTVTLSVRVNAKGRTLLRKGSLKAAVTIKAGTRKLKTLTVQIAKPAVYKKTPVKQKTTQQ